MRRFSGYHIILILLAVCFSWALSAQESLSELLSRHNSDSIPYISVYELAMPKNKAVLLDAREISEYKISHIENAIHVGYNDFNLSKTIEQLKDKDQPIVVYCSLGIRSEIIARKLKNEGFKNVFNLYGGIFEWKNKGFEVFDSNDTITDSVHVFSKQWDKWLLNGTKVYD